MSGRPSFLSSAASLRDALAPRCAPGLVPGGDPGRLERRPGDPQRAEERLVVETVGGAGDGALERAGGTHRWGAAHPPREGDLNARDRARSCATSRHTADAARLSRSRTTRPGEHRAGRHGGRQAGAGELLRDRPPGLAEHDPPVREQGTQVGRRGPVLAHQRPLPADQLRRGVEVAGVERVRVAVPSTSAASAIWNGSSGTAMRPA